jgi:hypothetical protein
MPGPRYPERLERLFAALMHLDNLAILPQIRCPPLVVGGQDDRVIDPSIQREMAALIPHSQLKAPPRLRQRPGEPAICSGGRALHAGGLGQHLMGTFPVADGAIHRCNAGHMTRA